MRTTRIELALPDETWVDVHAAGSDRYDVVIRWGNQLPPDTIVLAGSRAVLSELAHQILRLTQPEGATDGRPE